MPNGLQDVDFSLVDRLLVPPSLHDVNGRFAFDARQPASEPSGLRLSRD